MHALKKILPTLLFPLFLFGLQTQLAHADWFGQQEGINDIGNQAYGQTDANTADLRIIVAQIIKVLLGFLGVIFLVLVVVAGYNYMTAQGDEGKIEKAISQIKAGVIGLVIILAAYSIANLVTEKIYEAIYKF